MELDIDSVLKERKFFQKIKCGDDGKKDTPVPISNTEVKLLSADSSWGFLPARVGRCHANCVSWALCPAYFVEIFMWKTFCIIGILRGSLL